MDNGDMPVFPVVIHDANGATTYYKGMSKREELIARFMMSPQMPKDVYHDRDQRALWAVHEADAALDAMDRRDVYGRND